MGGFKFNNPSEIVLDMALRLGVPKNQIKMLSIGLEPLNDFTDDGFIRRWFRSFPTLIKKGITKEAMALCRGVNSVCHRTLSHNFIRIQPKEYDPNFEENYPLNAIESIKIKQLLDLGQNLLSDLFFNAVETTNGKSDFFEIIEMFFPKEKNGSIHEEMQINFPKSPNVISLQDRDLLLNSKNFKEFERYFSRSILERKKET
ncbi:hypothetical protein M0812_11790 [Anaeramoeba flamelloides]|uniref:Uncharacterized protein n=1 Tax=Anaeramoeba flamelloides TaxID=1746091 RepID=A0AAV7ZM24_9EUKA|nr:hypothetical protein M0812_11790 [Anaeramoeba flamelloides]